MGDRADCNEIDRSTWTLAYANGGLWALGNGLDSTTLITYLAKDFGAEGFEVSLIVAFPQLAGVFRLIAPLVLDRFPNRKHWSIATFGLSGMSLVALPLVCWPDVLHDEKLSLNALITLWVAWHVWMFLGLVGFYSWLGDLGGEQRGRLFGVREMVMTLATIAGTVAASAFGFWWNEHHPKQEHWIANAILALVGAIFICVSVLPLALMRHEPRRGTNALSIREMGAALIDWRFSPLLAFNVWFSFANGLTAAPLGMFPYKVLGLSAATMLAYASHMRVGQAAIAPWIGKWFDTHGYRRPLIAAQILVACGVLFYLPATKSEPWWIAGAWTLWIAYAVLNVGLPTLTLKLSPSGNSPAYTAVAMAASGVSFACASLVGGYLIDAWKTDAVDILRTLIVIGFVLRLTAAGWLLLLPERGRSNELEA